MKRARFVMLGVMALTAGVLGLVACSGDDTVVSTNDAGADGSVADGQAADSGGGDSSATDSGTIDGGGGIDSGSVDAGPPTLASFLALEGKILCDRSAFCCGQLDAGPTDGGTCLNILGKYGFEDHAYPASDILLHDAAVPHVVVNQVQAQDCLTKLNLAGCTLGSTLNNQILTACTNALNGTLPIGQPCSYTLECAQPAYCKFVDGGANGTCSAIEGTGNSCANVDPNQNALLAGQEACTSRRYGATLEFCDTFNQLDAGANTCQAAQAQGATCYNGNYCQSGVACDPETYQCAQIVSFITASFCQALQ